MPLLLGLVAAVLLLVAWLLLGGDPAAPTRAPVDPGLEPKAAAAAGTTPPAMQSQAPVQQRTATPLTEDGRSQPQGVRGQAFDERLQPIGQVHVYLVENATNDLGAMWQAMNRGVPLLPLAETVTDAEGRFALGLRQADGKKRYDVHFLHDGFAAARLSQLQIQPGDWYDAGVVRLLAGTLLRGRVTAEGTQLPVPQAVVSLQSSSPFDDLSAAGVPGHAGGLQTRTDANGYYELQHAPRAGLCILAAAAPGFARVTRGQIEVGPPAVEVDFALPHGLVLEGVVIDTNGAPVAEAEVQAWPQTGQDVTPLQGFADQSGAFQVVGLREGPHRLRVRSRDCQMHEQADIAAGTVGLRLVLERRGSARARVLGADGRVLSKYVLGVRRWFQDNGGQIGSLPQIADMHVRPEDLQQGTVKVKGLDRGSYVFQVTADGHAKTLSLPFAIAANDDEPLVEVRLSRGVTLIGAVVDEANRAVAGATVQTQADGAQDDNPLYRMLAQMTPDRITRTNAVTDNQGQFRLSLLAFADYQLRITHTDYCELLQSNLRLQEEGEQQLPPLVLRRGTLVRGTATLDGKPAGQIKIVVGPPTLLDGRQDQPPAGSAVRTETVSNNDGSFMLPRRLPPGGYEIRAAQLAGASADTDIFRMISQLRKTAVPFTVVAGQEFAEHNLHLITDH
ncbi:MAG TPA: carboxypeptidase-like regulatory domain-containing protein [Planctomycetota bacterium]|nr:carboxypeptidase-like regulatory domain-containing protein [Planctomycetota bacterium]